MSTIEQKIMALGKSYLNTAGNSNYFGKATDSESALVTGGTKSTVDESIQSTNDKSHKIRGSSLASSKKWHDQGDGWSIDNESENKNSSTNESSILEQSKDTLPSLPNVTSAASTIAPDEDICPTGTK